MTASKAPRPGGRPRGELLAEALRVAAVLRDGRPRTVEALADAARLHTRTVRRILAALPGAGWALAVDTPPSATPGRRSRVYRLDGGQALPASERAPKPERARSRRTLAADLAELPPMPRDAYQAALAVGGWSRTLLAAVGDLAALLPERKGRRHLEALRRAARLVEHEAAALARLMDHGDWREGGKGNGPKLHDPDSRRVRERPADPARSPPPPTAEQKPELSSVHKRLLRIIDR